MNTSIYQNIATRTAGDIYIGVVGPVRTGKSTFIKRFMETQVIPNIDNVYRKERARDELPQSGSGRTIMTAEPKFVPEEAAQIQLPDGASFSVRLIDCVGYMVKGAIGQMEDDTPRMVTTPWYDHEIPMTEAAEIGTRKVIAEHSTIGIVITTDGTISDIPREDYLEAEERVIRELQELGKPFIVLLNSADPRGDRAHATAKDTYLVGLDDEHIAKLQESSPYYEEYIIPEGTYEGVPETKTVAVVATVIARDDVSEDDVYNICYTIFENMDNLAHDKAGELDVEFASGVTAVPYHAGAAKYFAEKGFDVPTK